MAPNAAAAHLVGGGLTAAGGGFGHSERTYRMLAVVPHLLGADTPPLQVSGELGADTPPRHNSWRDIPLCRGLPMVIVTGQMLIEPK
jgi:hypothetical protein